jgi:hypothetical protein
MKRLKAARLAGLAILACIVPAAVLPQAAPAAGRTISGAVVNAVTGLPIAGATVSLGKPKARRNPDQVQTDTEGRFAFPQLADGKYTLWASRRGYIGAAFEEHPGGFSTAVVTGEGLESTGLKIMLEPQAVLFGTVTDDSGDPVPQARINLYRPDPAGTGKMLRGNGTMSDGGGNYEISRLAPGSYYLSISGVPWYATHLQPRDSQGKAIESRRSPLDVAYAVTYYPDATTDTAAEPIVVAAGERMRVNLTMHPVPAVHISIQIPAPGANQPFVFPQLRQEIFGTMDYVQAAPMYQMRNSGRDSGPAMLELGGVAPGRYDMDLRSGGQAQSVRSVALDATSDQVNLDVSSATVLAEVSGKISAAGDGALPTGLNISLVPQQGTDHYNARPDADGSFKIESVRPGTYEVAANAAGVFQSVSHLSVNGAVVPGRFLKVGGEPVTLTARVTEVTASIGGFAKLEDKPASGVLVMLVPTSPSAGKERCRGYQSDSDGSFEFSHVPAGQYTLVAVQEGWTLEWAHPEALARYLAKGVQVTVPPHSNEIAVKDPVNVQAK